MTSTLQSLLAERQTAFDHTLWDRFTFIDLLRGSAQLTEQDNYDMRTLGYSFTQDATYGLLGRIPNESPIGRVWAKVFSAAGIDDMIEQFRDGDAATRISMVTQITDVIRTATQPRRAEQPQPQPTPEQPPQQPEFDLSGDIPFDAEEDAEEPEDEEQPEDGDADDAEEPEDGDEDGTEDAGDVEDALEALDADEGPEEGTETDDDADDEQDDVTGALAMGLAEEQMGQEFEANADEFTVEIEGGEVKFNISAMLDQAATASSLFSFLDPESEPQERLKAVEQVMNRISCKGFIDMLGWASRIIRGEARKHQSHSGAMTGYYSAGWADSVVPSDMLGVVNGDPQTLARLADESLSHRKYEGDQTLGKGPVILLRDESSSMMQKEGKYTRDERAVALELAMVKAFHDDRRDLVSVAWSSSGTRQHTYGDREQLGRGTGITWMNDSAYLSKFLGGGTRIEPALYAALDAADEYVSGADILIVTDGEIQFDPTATRYSADNLPQPLMERIAKYRTEGGRIWGVRIGGSRDAEQWNEAMKFMDGFVEGSDLETGDKKLADILRRMAGHDAEMKGGRRTL